MPKKKKPGALKRERRKRQNQDYRNCQALVMIYSVALVRATLAVSPDYLSKSFIAAAYYLRVDPTRLNEIENARRKYDSRSQTWRDNRLRAYSDTLRRKGITFKRVVEAARKPPNITIVRDSSIQLL